MARTGASTRPISFSTRTIYRFRTRPFARVFFGDAVRGAFSVVAFTARASCETPPAPPPQSARPPTVAAEQPRVIPSSSTDPIAGIRERGALHVDPIHVPAFGKMPESWFVVLGTKEVAHAAWVVTGNAKT